MSVPARKSSPLLKADTGQQRSAPLRQCVRDALEDYLANLQGEDTNDLFRLVMGEVEPPILEAVLAHTRGNQSRAAEMLGINRGTLRKKLKFYGLE